MTRPPATLGIGTATFRPDYGNVPGRDAGERLLRAALDGGVRYLDTAADYGDGERAIGCVAGDGVRVCTKLPAAATLDDVAASTARLGRAPDTILMHSAGAEQMAAAPIVGVLREAKARGLVQRIGASTYGVDNARHALQQPWCDAVQVEYSVLNQSVMRGISRRASGQEIVVRSVLCRGLLTARPPQSPRLPARAQDAIDALAGYARDWNRGIEELAIRVALDTPGVDVVLVGVGTDDELEIALRAAASRPLTIGEWDRLAALDRSDEDVTHPERWKAL